MTARRKCPFVLGAHMPTYVLACAFVWDGNWDGNADGEQESNADRKDQPVLLLVHADTVGESKSLFGSQLMKLMHE